MSNPDLLKLFDALDAPPQSTGGEPLFAAKPIPRLSQYRIAKDALGASALLLSAPSNQTRARPVPVELENLRVLHDVECKITKPNGALETGRFSLAQCTGQGVEIHAYFLRICGAITQALGKSPTRAQIDSAIGRLVELFRAMSLPSRKSVQGLWAELFLIVNSSHPIALIESWHTTPEDRYDFCAGMQRIEVKSVNGQSRKHHFSLEQLNPPARAKVVVASMFVERAGGGMPLSELMDMARSRVSDRPDLLAHIDKIVALALGKSWANAMRDRFDRERAEESLRFFHADTIPSVKPKLPKGVSEVRFAADLTGIAPADLPSLRQEGDLLEAL